METNFVTSYMGYNGDLLIFFKHPISLAILVIAVVLVFSLMRVNKRIEAMSTFGVTLECIEARELINRAKALTLEDCAEEMAEANATLVGLDQTPQSNSEDFIRLYKAYKDYLLGHMYGLEVYRY